MSERDRFVIVVDLNLKSEVRRSHFAQRVDRVGEFEPEPLRIDIVTYRDSAAVAPTGSWSATRTISQEDFILSYVKHG